MTAEPDAPLTEGTVQGGERGRVRTSRLTRNLIIRFPDAITEVERILVDANHRARSLSLEWAAGAVPAVDWPTMADTTDASTLVVAQMPDEVVEALQVEDLLDRLAEYHDPSDRTLVKLPDQSGGQQPIPGDTIIPAYHPLLINRLAHGPLAGVLRSGQTVIMNQVEQFGRGVATLADHLGRVLGCVIGINCYVSYGSAEGFGAHWDDHDVLIVQTHGRKYWEVYQPTALSALRPNVSEDTSDQLVWSGVLEPGSAVMIPRGWGHRVESFDELSVHLTIGLNRYHTLALVDHLATEASNYPLFRADTPFHLGQVPVSYGGSVFDSPPAFAEHLAPVLDVALPRGLARWRASMAMTPISAYMDTLHVSTGDRWEDGRFSARLPGGIMVADQGVDSEPGHAVLAAGQRIIEMPSEFVPIFAACASGDEVTLADLVEQCPQLDITVVRAAIRRLVDAGVVNVVGRVAADE